MFKWTLEFELLYILIVLRLFRLWQNVSGNTANVHFGPLRDWTPQAMPDAAILLTTAKFNCPVQDKWRESDHMTVNRRLLAEFKKFRYSTTVGNIKWYEYLIPFNIIIQFMNAYILGLLDIALFLYFTSNIQLTFLLTIFVLKH